MSTIRSVAVVGSCITRDNFNSRFNSDHKLWFTVGATTNQSSMIALMSPPVTEPWGPLGKMTPYETWNVGSDLSREILDLLRVEPPDLLVMDFFGDVHFGVLRTGDGRYVTNNRWRIQKTNLYGRLMEDHRTQVFRWQDDEAAYFVLWKDAMDRFASHVAEHCPGTRVVVHCGFNARAMLSPDSPVPVPLNPKGRAGRRANAYWARLNKHAADTYGWDHIDLRDEWYLSFSEHPWGPFAVHYTLDYYHRFLAELHRLALHDELLPGISSRVDAVGAAAAARCRAEVTYWRDLEGRIAPPGSRGGRLRRLIGRGPARADSERPAVGTGEDYRLLEGLRSELDSHTLARVFKLAQSADEHVSWVRRTREERLAFTRSQTGHR